jgi:hypothetical protein
LRSRNFALIWSAALVSNIGTWMQTVALGYLVTAGTRNPLWTGAVAAAAFVPNGLLAPVGGALADRFDRRRWLIVTTVAEAVLALGMAGLAADGAGPGTLTAVAFAGGVASAIGFPTYQAMLPDLVPRQDVLGAVSLAAAQFNLGRVIGPALAGVVLVVGSAAWVFAANAASFAAVVVALVLVRLRRRETVRSGPGIVRRMAEGARLAAAIPGCRSAIVLISVVALVGSPFIGLIPAVAVVGLHGAQGGSHGAGATSVLVTGQGIGAVAGALAIAPVAAALGRRRMVTAALVAFPGDLVLYGIAPGLWGTAAAIVVVGGCYIGVLSGLNTVIQLHAPEAARGRILGLYMMALGTIYPIGLLVQGAVAGAVGIRLVTVASGVALLVVVAAVGLGRPRILQALDDPAGPAGVGDAAVGGPAGAVA